MWLALRLWRLWATAIAFFFAPVFCAQAVANGLTAEDIVHQPVMVEGAGGHRIQDKFVFYERDGIFVLNRFLIDTDIQACIDLSKPHCTTAYESAAAVRKAAAIYFAYPVVTNRVLVESTLREQVVRHHMQVTTTWRPAGEGIRLTMDVVREPAFGGKAEQFSRSVLVSPSHGFAGMRMRFQDNVADGPWIESLFRVRDQPLRNAANAAIRINNHFYNRATGKYRVRHGSGFFYRNRHQVMTAWHNLSANDECRTALRCELRFLHTDKLGVKRRFRDDVQILAFSEDDDFALLRLDTPAKIPANILPIEREWIGSAVSIIGYPSPSFNLLYSHGYLNSLTRGSRRLVASAHVVGGFSGAPIVDLGTGRIVGFAKAWQRPKGLAGEGGPVSFNLVRVLEARFGL